MPISVGGGSQPDVFTDIRTNQAVVPYGSYNQLMNDANNDILNPSVMGLYLANGTIYNFQWQSGVVGSTPWQFPVLLGDTCVDGLIANPTGLTLGVTAPAYTIPLNAVIKSVTYRNTTANAVTGGITIGTAVSGNQVSSTVVVGANAMVVTQGSSLTLSSFPSSTYTFASYPNGLPLYFNAGSSWNGAIVNITIEFYVAF